MSKEKPQIDKFREAAKELGIDEADAAFEAAVIKVAKTPKITDDEIKEFVRQRRKEGKE